MGIGRLWYDDNLLNLQPIGLESVELERKLLTETNQSAWFALSVADGPAEALRRKAGFTALPTVERVEELASLFPADRQQKRPVIERDPPAAGEFARPGAAHSRALAARVGPTAMAVGQLPAGAAADERRRPGAMGQFPELLRQVPPRELYQRLSDYQQRIADDLLEPAARAAQRANPDRPPWPTCRDSLVQRFVGRQRQLPAEDLREGRHLGHGRPRTLRPRHPHAWIRTPPAIRCRSTKPRGT